LGARPGAPQQLGVPPQLQQQQQLGGGARFAPQGRPQAQPNPASPFTVFNPNSFIRS
jgi:hypothetical protein